MRIIIRKVNNRIDNEKCIFIRREVFIKEQNIPESLELDDNKIESIKFLATYNNESIGTARYRATSKGMKLERFAVIKQYRGYGVGKALVLFILEELKMEESIYLHAQESVIKFYTKLGFKIVGDRFFEADIPHIKLIKK
jgi:predicted GNAT family N-acyltransferase|tara:strand:- start:2663 stop:3082 length:420 start_codon:yes stop_codon:yes gene_type:complete